MDSHTHETTVVIIGGGLVGLSAAMLLAWQDVNCIILERRASPSLHPRAVGYTPRTMEIFNTVGIADQIPQVDEGFKLRRVKVESMTGKWEEQPMPWKPSIDREPAAKDESPQYTPFRGAALAQDRLEPIICTKAQELGADIRIGVHMTEFHQDSNGVTVSVSCKDGSEYQIKAAYMIAADGHRSTVRQKLNIPTTGRGHLNTVRSVLFRASLDQYQQGYQQFVIRQPDLQAFLTTYGDDRWVLMFTDDVERSDEEQSKAIRRAVGLENLEFEIITTGRWELKASIADYFQDGRIFIAGDAAHTLPPTRGGYGANTGIHDVQNLAWKLAAVIHGKCRPEILDSYSKERQPVAWLRHQQTFARPDYAQYRQPSDDETEIYDDSAIELGQIYIFDIIYDDEESSPLQPPARLPDQWRGRPGTRAPYVLLKTSDGEEKSSLDLFGSDWVLISEDERWEDVVSNACCDSKLKIRCIIINAGGGYVDDGWVLKSLGLQADGASLVRPDGNIAWRSKQWEADA